MIRTWLRDNALLRARWVLALALVFAHAPAQAEEHTPRPRLERTRVSGVSRFGVGARFGYRRGTRARLLVGYGMDIGPRRAPRYAFGLSAAFVLDSRGLVPSEDDPEMRVGTGASYALRLGLPQTIAIGRRSERLSELHDHALVFEPTLSFGRIDGEAMVAAYGGGITFVLGCIVSIGVHVEHADADFEHAFAASALIALDVVRLFRGVDSRGFDACSAF